MYLIVIIILLALIIGWYVSTNNSLVRARALAEEAYSTMDIYLKKRFDLVPNLVNVVKGYTEYESDTLKSIIEMRNASPNINPKENLNQQNEIESGISKVFALAEDYPDLKSDGQFLGLQKQLSDIENDIANARKYYNGAVRELNTKVKSFPSKIVASLGGFYEMPYYEAANEQKENVKVEF